MMDDIDDTDLLIARRAEIGLVDKVVLVSSALLLIGFVIGSLTLPVILYLFSATPNWMALASCPACALGAMAILKGHPLYLDWLDRRADRSNR